MPAPLVLVSAAAEAPLLARADALGVQLQVVTLDSREGADARILLAGGGLRAPDLPAVLRDHPAVRWMHVPLAGVDAWLVPEVHQRNIMVTRTRDVHGAYVSEFTMGLVIAAAKRFREIFAAQQAHQWLDMGLPLIRDSHMVIVGYGEIGLALAVRAKAFGMQVTGVRRHPQPDGVADQVIGTDGLLEALRGADFVVLLLPGGPRNHAAFGVQELAALPQRAFLINVGRGEVLDEAALDTALRARRFAGALIDTFTQEPLPPEDPLWTNPRVVVTSHLAGTRVTPLSEQFLDQFLSNITRYQAGQPLLNQIDLALGY